MSFRQLLTIDENGSKKLEPNEDETRLFVKPHIVGTPRVVEGGDTKAPEEDDDDIIPGPRASPNQTRDNIESVVSRREERISMGKAGRTHDTISGIPTNAGSVQQREKCGSSMGSTNDSGIREGTKSDPAHPKNRSISDASVRTRRKAMELMKAKNINITPLRKKATGPAQKPSNVIEKQRTTPCSAFQKKMDTMNSKKSSSRPNDVADDRKSNIVVDDLVIVQTSSTSEESFDTPSVHIRKLFEEKTGQSLGSFGSSDSHDDGSERSCGARLRAAIEDEQNRVFQDDDTGDPADENRPPQPDLRLLYKKYVTGSLERKSVVRTGNEWTAGYRERRLGRRGRLPKKRVGRRVPSLPSGGSIASGPALVSVPASSIDEMGFAGTKP